MAKVKVLSVVTAEVEINLPLSTKFVNRLNELRANRLNLSLADAEELRQYERTVDEMVKADAEEEGYSVIDITDVEVTPTPVIVHLEAADWDECLHCDCDFANNPPKGFECTDELDCGGDGNYIRLVYL